jgi:hypothetical protein
MRVAEIILPGTSLQQDPSWSAQEANDVQGWLRTLPTELDRLAVALGLFEESLAHQEPLPTPEQWDRDRARERIHREALVRADILLPRGEMDLRVTRDLRRADWKGGAIPHSYRRAIALMHAESFVAHADMILKLLKNISKVAALRLPTLNPIVVTLEAAITGAKDVRDSTQHRDERIVGKAQEKTIVPQPISTKGIHAPGGAMIVGMLEDNRLGYTAADGRFVQVEVSATTLSAAQVAVQATLDAFSWSGRKSYHPSR